MKLHPFTLLLYFFTSTLFAQTNLQWQSAGPFNAGGRTCALLVDKRDSTGQTIYAGTAGGGLWKSTDGANTWNRLEHNEWTTITCIAQAVDGAIYYGTGNFATNSGFPWGVGNGIYFLNYNDQPQHLSATTSTSTQNGWAYVRRIACDPLNADRLYAATPNGLFVTINKGQSWDSIALNASPSYPSANDVKFSKNGDKVYANVGYKVYRSLDAGASWQRLDTIYPGFVLYGGRIEIAVSPTDNDYVYLNVATSSAMYGGTYRSTDGGNTWTKINQPGSGINIFQSGTGWFSNCIAVAPFDANKVYFGGENLYNWSPLVGVRLCADGLTDITQTYGVGKYQQTLAFNPYNPNELYVGTSFGVYKTTEAQTQFLYPRFSAKNRGYVTTMLYDTYPTQSGAALAAAEDVGILQSTCEHDNGTTQFNDQYSSFVAASQIFDDVYFYQNYYDNLMRSRNSGTFFSCAYDLKTDPDNDCEPSVCGGFNGQNAAFEAPMYLQESTRAFNSTDSVSFTDAVDHFAGETITAESRQGKYPLKHTLTQNLPAGSTLKVCDYVKSRLYVSSYCGIWVTPDAAVYNGNLRWYKLYKGSNLNATAFATSADGNTVYFGATNANRINKVTGLNNAANYTYLPDTAITFFADSANRSFTSIISTGSGYVNGISVNPLNEPTILCTVRRDWQFATPYNRVFKSTNGGTTWTALTNGLPNAPVYDCLIDAADTNHYIVATQFGIYSSHDAGNAWAEDNAGYSRTPVLKLHQVPVSCDTCYTIFAASFGRGIWKADAADYACAMTGVNEITADEKKYSFHLYPNPSSGELTVEAEAGVSFPLQLQIRDIAGRLVAEEKITSARSNFNYANLQQGLYSISILSTNGNMETRKWIVGQ